MHINHAAIAANPIGTIMPKSDLAELERRYAKAVKKNDDAFFFYHFDPEDIEARDEFRDTYSRKTRLWHQILEARKGATCVN